MNEFSTFVSSSALKKRLLSGGGWAFGLKTLAIISSLAVNGLLARLLTPEEMGAYFLTFSLVSVSAIIAQMGLEQTVVRLIAESLGMRKPARAGAAIRIVFKYGIISALVTALVIYSGVGRWLAVYVFKSQLMAGAINLAAVWAIMLAWQILLAAIFRGFSDIRLASLFERLTASVLSAGLFAFLWIMQGRSYLSQVLILSLVASGISVLIAGFILRRKIRSLSIDRQLQDKEVLRIAWPILVVNLALFARSQVSIWVLGALRTQQEVAIYGAAWRLVNLVAVPLALVNAVLPPFIAEMYVQDKRSQLERILRITAFVTGLPALAALTLFILLGGPILGLIYGSYYREATMVLIILSTGRLMGVWAGSCQQVLMMTNHQKILMWVMVSAGLLSASLALLLADSHGAVGVAFASAVSLALENLITVLIVRRKVGIWTNIGDLRNVTLDLERYFRMLVSRR